jgi:SAM-dependent methyltransferase
MDVKELNQIFERFELNPEKERELALLVGKEDSWRRKQRDQSDLLGEINPRCDQRFLELGCGPLRFGVGLIEWLNEGCYTGVDINERSISEGKALITQLGLGAKKPELFCLEDFGLSALEHGSFDLIWAYNVLIHLSEAKLVNAFYSVSRLLKGNGRAIVTLRLSQQGGFVQTGKWLEFPICAAPFFWYAKIADELGMKFTAIKPISDIQHCAFKGAPCYYLASLTLK